MGFTIRDATGLLFRWSHLRILFFFVVLLLANEAFLIGAVDAKQTGDNASKKASGSVWFNPFPFNLVLTNECAEEFFVKFNFLHVECLKKSIIKALGYAIVVLSSILKLPIIINILKSKSAIGLSPTSLLIEISALCASFSQSIIKKHPFSACSF